MAVKKRTSTDKSESPDLSILGTKRHPLYDSMLSHWNFLESCYEGGRSWFKSENIFRYMKEGDTEYSDRLKRAYRFNHSKEIVELVNKYLFKAQIVRNEENAPVEIVKFWQSATKGGGSIDKLLRHFARRASIYGRVWIVVDNNQTSEIESKLDERKSNVKVYAYTVKPQDVLDVGYNDVGDRTWVLIREYYRDNSNPLSSGLTLSRYRLWTQTTWHLFDVKIENLGSAGEKITVTENDSGAHNLGIVPVFPHDHVESENQYTSPSLIDDVAYLDRACANYLSNLDAIIQDQTFSQLAMPVQGLIPGEKGYDKLLEMGTKRIFTYDGADGGKPFYLSPDVKQVEIILAVLNKIINEIYHTVGMAGERTKQDNAIGIDNSSGVAKAYDFERVNALLTSKAFSVKSTEIDVLQCVMLWYGKKVTKEEVAALLTYPDSFDIRDISDEFDIASRLILIEAPLDVRKEQLKILVERLFPTLKTDLLEKLKRAIDDMEDMNLDAMNDVTNQNSKKLTENLELEK